jgi:N-acetylmuramic acid 6-phosphate etherase
MYNTVSMLERLTTEQTNPESSHLDELSTLHLLEIMNAADAQVASAVAQEIPRIGAAIQAIIGALESGGSLLYIGAGTSGRLAVLDAAECPPTFGVPADLVRGISASGRTPYVLGAVAKARETHALTCGISCIRDSELSGVVQYPIEPVPGPEILTGSTRLRAGTATKLVLNMISTAVMVKLGHVYGNLMVNVQPTNRKLEDRARRIIQAATGVSYDQATELLNLAGRSVRVAIIMQQKQLSREKAEILLSRANGRIREALALG